MFLRLKEAESRGGDYEMGKKGRSSFREENSQELCKIFRKSLYSSVYHTKPSIWIWWTPGLFFLIAPSLSSQELGTKLDIIIFNKNLIVPL